MTRTSNLTGPSNFAGYPGQLLASNRPMGLIQVIMLGLLIARSSGTDLATYYSVMADLSKIEDTELRAILESYTVDSAGRINSPGKMEGEPLYVPYFWDTILNGFADDSESDDVNPDADVIHISADDIAIFPELDGYTRALLWESDNGFVFCDLDKKEVPSTTP